MPLWGQARLAGEPSAGRTQALHGLLLDRLVEYLQQFRLVKDHLVSCQADHLVAWRQLDGIDRACLFAHPAEDAAKFIDIELLRVFFPVFPRRFLCDDVNAIGRAGRCTHETGNAPDPAILVTIQPVHTSEGRLELPPLFDGSLIAFLFWILDDPEVLLVLSIPTDIPEAMPEGRSQPLEHGRKKQAITTRHWRRAYVNDVTIFNGHCMVPSGGSAGNDIALAFQIHAPG